jgi:hypothetical protein
MNEWIFVTGAPRSGTALAMYLLNLHPDCCILGETGFPTHLLQALQPPVAVHDGYCSLEWRGRDQISCVDWVLPRLCSPTPGKRDSAPTAVEIARSLCTALRGFWPKRLFGDKSPAYCFQWRVLRELFPDCLIVVCERDLEATIDSVARQRWAPPVEGREELRDWVLRYHRAVAECPGAIRLSLETLESDPEAQVRQLLAASDLDPLAYPMAHAVDQICHGRVN